METHWSTRYVLEGRKWSSDYNCWSFAKRVWKEDFGVDVPDVDINLSDLKSCLSTALHYPEHASWEKVCIPREGDAVAMGGDNYTRHVGVWTWLNGGRIVHCIESSGVIITSIRETIHLGWSIRGYYAI